VQRRLPDTIRLLLSGLAELDLTVLADHAGSITKFVKKPWRNGELLEVLAELLEERARSKRTASGIFESAALKSL
jgi:hypothetical protein